MSLIKLCGCLYFQPGRRWWSRSRGQRIIKEQSTSMTPLSAHTCLVSTASPHAAPFFWFIYSYIQNVSYNWQKWGLFVFFNLVKMHIMTLPWEIQPMAESLQPLFNGIMRFIIINNIFPHIFSSLGVILFDKVLHNCIILAHRKTYWSFDCVRKRAGNARDSDPIVDLTWTAILWQIVHVHCSICSMNVAKMLVC